MHSKKNLVIIIAIVTVIGAIIDIAMISSNISLFWHILSIFLIFLYLLKIYSTHPSYLLSSFFQIYAFIALIFSLLIGAQGVDLFEIGRIGAPNGAFAICSIFFVAGLEAGLAGFRATAGNLPIQTPVHPALDRLNFWGLYVAPVAMLISALLIFIFVGSPISSGINRITFWQVVVPDWLQRFPSAFGQSFFLAAALWFASKRGHSTKLLAGAVTIGYLVATAVVLGEKFSVFILYLWMWCSVWAASSTGHKLTFRIVAGLMSFAVALLLLIGATYLSQGREFVFIAQRLALQAQLLWSVLNENFSILVTGVDWRCMLACSNFESGRDFISARYMPSELFIRYQVTGSNLTGYMPSLPILAIGAPLALLLHMAYSYFLGIAQKYMVYIIANYGVIYALLAFKIYNGLVIIWYGMNLYALGGVIIASIILAIILGVPHFVSPLRRRGQDS